MVSIITNKLTTVRLDAKIHALALKHNISLSGACRTAITKKVEALEAAEKETGADCQVQTPATTTNGGDGYVCRST